MVSASIGRSSGEKFSEDMLNHRATISGADPDAEPGDIANMIEDGFHSVMAAGRAAGRIRIRPRGRETSSKIGEICFAGIL